MIAILVFGLVALSAVCLWLLIEQRKSWKFLVWFIPILLVLSASTYVTYTSILGYPKVAIPHQGMYLQHYIAKPNWIYLWVLGKNNVPMSYQIVYSKEAQESLEGVKGEASEGKFMVLGEVENPSEGGEEEGDNENSNSGYTIGGDIGFYEWNFETDIRYQKDTQQ